MRHCELARIFKKIHMRIPMNLVSLSFYGLPQIWHELVQQTNSTHLIDVAQAALKFFEVFSPIYTVIFVIVRSVIGPPAVVWLALRLVDTPGLPPAVRCE